MLRRETEGGRKGQLVLRLNARAIALGLAQLVAWGTLYYSIALLGAPMARDLGIDGAVPFAMFSGSLVLSALLAPSVGRWIDRRGGRRALVTGGVAGAAGFASLALAHSVPVLAAGLMLNGIAMALGLYDACFAAVAQHESGSYRRTVTAITLLGGLASSVFWPVTHALLQAVGWRATCAVFVLLLVGCAVLHASVLPRRPHSEGSVLEAGIPLPRAADGSTARWLSLAFVGAALLGGAMSAHLPSVLEALRLPSSTAVGIASSVGVFQVLGRLVELLARGRVPAPRLGLLVFAAIAVGLWCLLAAEVEPWFVVPFALLYGVANGLLTVLRAVVPLEICGTERAGAVLGRFARPSLLARALAPGLFAASVANGGVLAALGVCAGVALVSLAAFSMCVRSVTRLPILAVQFSFAPPGETAPRLTPRSPERTPG